jgi:L-lactate dehydrogenase complex protein LldG
VSAAREEILGKVRRAAGPPATPRAADFAAISRDYVQAGTLDLAGRIELLTDRLNDYGAGVYPTTRAELAATIAKAVSARGKHRLVIPGGLSRDWLPDSLEFIPDVGLDYRDLDASDGTVTGCMLAIALTGSIVLTHGGQEGRRALTLVPDYHLCVIFAEQVVETVPEAMRAMHAAGAGLVTTIAGPSATADIEMTRVKGVHGPRVLDVILVL